MWNRYLSNKVMRILNLQDKSPLWTSKVVNEVNNTSPAKFNSVLAEMLQYVLFHFGQTIQTHV